MAIKEYRKPGETVEWPASDVETHLKGLGFLIGPGGLGVGLEVAPDGTAGVLVRVDLDANVPDAALVAALDAFAPAPDPIRTARGYLLGRAREIKAKAPGTRTQAERDLLAVLVVIRQDQ